MYGASVSAGLAKGLVEYAIDRGATKASLLECAEIDEATLTDVDERLPMERYKALLDCAKLETGDPAISLHYAEDVSMSDVSIVGFIMEMCETMGEAFLQLQRYSRLAAEFDDPTDHEHFVLESSGDKLLLEDRREASQAFYQLKETAFVRLVCGPRRFLDRPHVLAAHFTHADPGYGDEYRRIFECPVHFGASRNAMELHPEVAKWPINQQPKYVLPVLKQHAEALLSDLDLNRSWRGRTEKALLNRLHEGGVSADVISGDFGFSRQTLFRKLKDEETTFADVLASLRAKLAKNYLTNKKTPIHEIAFLLGFSETASFSRAFKKWSDLSPEEYRYLHSNLNG